MFHALAEILPVGRAVVAIPQGSSREHRPGVEVIDAGHPAPTYGSVAAGLRALAVARGRAGTEGLFVLLSGGASAMLAVPAPGITLEDKVHTSRALMAAGAPIDELNCVRKHLSSIKGGQLAVAARRSLTLALSDVHAPVEDDPSVIGSGPTVPDRSTFAQAREIVARRGVRVSDAVRTRLEQGVRGEVEETPKPGDSRIGESVFRVIGNRHTAAAGCRTAAEERGYRVIVVAAATAGEAREAARAFVESAAVAPGGPPLCVIASGETTVTVRGDGLGGRNQEFALAAAAAVSALSAGSARPIVLGSAGTDGIDGPTDAAGAIVDATTLERARCHGLEVDAFLARNDAYRFFEPIGDLIRWGPTGTNVGDLHVLLAG